MTLPWSSNELLTGWKFTSRLPIVILKPGKQSYSSVTSLQEDADLKIELPELSATYEIDVNLATSGAVAGDIVLEWTTTGDPTVVRTMQALTATGASSTDTEIICRELATTAQQAGTTHPTQSTVRETLLVTVGADPVVLQLRWAQNSSNTTSTTVQGYSWAVAQRII